MRAIVFHAPGDIRLEEVPAPVPGAGKALVQVEVALTDGTDFKAYRRGHRVLLGDGRAPFGHEFCGIDTATGRRVVAPNSAPCERCDGCRRGELCRDLELLNGAYAELLLVPERIASTALLPVPTTLAPRVAAMLEPLACCLNAIELAAIEPGHVVTVIGTGATGLMLCGCAADAGAEVAAVGRRPERDELVRAFGAEPGDGLGADVVIEAAGTDRAWLDALDRVRPGGTVVLFGGLAEGTTVPIDAHRLHYEELTLRGAFHHRPRHVRAALAFLASGARPWERLITHEVGLDGLPAFFADPPRDLLKAAVYP